MNRCILTLSCPDRLGIVHAVSGFLADRGANILDSQQFGDRSTRRFFMRVHIECTDPRIGIAELRRDFSAVAEAFSMTWQIHDEEERTRTIIMVSRLGHCLNDLLYRWHIGALPADIVAVVSNHRDFEDLAASYGIPYHYIPVTPETKAQAEDKLLALVDEASVDLIVLARYMQILSPTVCERLPGKIINIHHSFLPSFRGARPYHQAYERGVKLIGATAHYVTATLDEGPIIEQEVARVDHTYDVAHLAEVGRDLECLALARAVRWHLEHRVLLDGNKTVVFR
ncbi:formyltetrahydrofolate deformylase [Acidothermus cellulolyticus 11B]|uniref:Formyltetrahydrofolate deformylase n=1 Tax=Acidothermus cellulolyticus (strain ATCC 43068 / DSM 8971 / 11B) TaxID=351607 RepID=A0LR69_ACIC1|nr:formyltetrahydrofolate deformylase [Acidothermus cellulolyticus]ABK51929.1 formyltetrahydrofolate deformylase [Acidothermus cellulolyticus 11B]